MQHFTIGDGFDSQPVIPVTEAGPGTLLATWGDGGVSAHVVSEWAPGVQAVMFENGPPPGSVQHMMMYHQIEASSAPPDPTPEELLLLL